MLKLLTNILNLDITLTLTNNKTLTFKSNNKDTFKGQNLGVSVPGDKTALFQIKDKLIKLKESFINIKLGLLTLKLTLKVKTQPQTQGLYPYLINKYVRSPFTDYNGLKEIKELFK